MRSLCLVLAEIRARKLSALLVTAAVAVSAATVLCVAGLNRALSEEVRELGVDMGTNLIIFPADAERDRYFVGGDPDPRTLAESSIDTLLSLDPPVARHIVGKLMTSVEVNGTRWLLVGVSPERDTSAKSKTQLGIVISPGTVHVGFVAAEKLALNVGRSVTLGGRTFRVEKVLPEEGSQTDASIFAPLAEVQAMVGKPGRVSVVEALGCLCAGDYLSIVKRDVEQALPGTYAVSVLDRAVARKRVRDSAAEFGRILAGVVVTLAGVGAAAAFLVNVRERRTEVGILRAMGWPARRVAWLFLAKALMLGLTAGVLAFLAATGFAHLVGPRIAGGPVELPRAYLLWGLGFALVLGTVASLPAVWQLSRLDPADVLRGA